MSLVNLEGYQYKDLVKTAATFYSGELAVVTTDDTHYNVVSPVNYLILDTNYSEASETFIIADTLSGASDEI